MRKEGKEKELQELGREDLQVTEWTDPVDGEKEIFFRNLFSGIQEPFFEAKYGKRLSSVVMLCQIFLVSAELDNPLVILDFGGVDGEWNGWWAWIKAKAEDVVTATVMGLVSAIARYGFGLKAVNEEWTPEWLIERWEKRRGEERRKKKN